MTTTRGIKKVSEKILTDGRAIIVTEKDKDQYDWNEIPVGSKFIDTTTGIEQVKLEGQSDWVPANTKNDGTLCIAKDAVLKTEVFTIKTLDDGDGYFSYTNTDGELRHLPKTNMGYVFEIENGTYAPSRNHLEVYIDSVLRRTAQTGGLTELSTRRFELQEDLKVGQEITAQYYNVLRVGNPYPRIFIGMDDPDDSEVGDVWIDTDATLAEKDFLGETDQEANKTISWDRITGKPTNTQEYKIYDEIKGMISNTRIEASMIDNLPTLPDKIDAYTVQGRSLGTSANNIFLVPSDGRIPSSMLPTSTANKDDIPDIRIGASTPSNPINNKTVWFCTTVNDVCVKAYIDNKWVKFGAVWG